MEYMTTAQAAEKWRISDRRIRTLCKEGKIKGFEKPGVNEYTNYEFKILNNESYHK